MQDFKDGIRSSSLEELENDLKPYEFHQFLKDFHHETHQEITTLRIEKSLYQHFHPK